MSDLDQGEVTKLLKQLQSGDEQAESRLIQAVYPELRKLASAYMRRERPDHTLQPTALVNEAYLKLTGQMGVDWQNRAHFFAVAAKLMRRILVDHARGHLAEKRGAGAQPLPIDERLVISNGRPAEMVALDDALSRLGERDARALRVIELRFFGGLSVQETAAVLAVSERTVKREWSFGRAWLKGEMASGTGV